MRAGSLSSKPVVRKLKSEFVCAWDNTEGQCNSGGSFAHPPSDPAPHCSRGNGEHNVQMLFLTPDRKLMHTVAGYVSNQDLMRELTFVENLWAMVKRARTDSAKKHLIANAHKRALRDLDQRVFVGPLRQFAERRVRADHAFVRDHPLLPASEYRSEDHVGKAATFFGSSSSGGRPKGRIGEPRHSWKLKRSDDLLGGGGSAIERLRTLLESKELPESVKEQLKAEFAKGK